MQAVGRAEGRESQASKVPVLGAGECGFESRQVRHDLSVDK
ncbi:hypothetical protein DM49_1497 [Burkholderia mallei]|nr:hypothetical protein DP49_5530 [Burkholderia pseudomallei]KGX58939.1 hypothetical protein Y027_3048 [Burkholderia pseudomallei TSV5]KOS88835.1 hypothetical protein DM53_3478 [Burkholderia mallei]KOS94997.1 hypothetical protein DM49_1497 [Burkholderia mallei]